MRIRIIKQNIKTIISDLYIFNPYTIYSDSFNCKNAHMRIMHFKNHLNCLEMLNPTNHFNIVKYLKARKIGLKSNISACHICIIGTQFETPEQIEIDNKKAHRMNSLIQAYQNVLRSI